jgi:subtilisin
MNDPRYDIQLPEYHVDPIALSAGQVVDWGNVYLQAAAAHEFTRGENAVVFVLDTAGTFADHPDLAVNNLQEFNKNLTNSPDRDHHGHGTHCAGIVAGVDNEVGVMGIAPAAGLVACKVLNDSGGGSYMWISQMIRYVADLEDAGRLKGKRRILSLSLGGPAGQATPSHLKSAIDYAIGRGCFIIVAAGNSGFSGGSSTVGPPGNYAPVITVASTDQPGDRRSSFSAGGREIDLAAPGGAIYSTHKNGGYAKLSGTSMACPQVAGVAALILSLRSDIDSQDKLAGFLAEHATDILQPGRDDDSGLGVPRLERYLNVPEGNEPVTDDDETKGTPSPEDEWAPVKLMGRKRPDGSLDLRVLFYGNTNASG